MRSYLKIGGLLLSVFFFNSCIFQGGIPMYVGGKDSCGFAVSQFSGQGLRWSEDRFPVSFYVHDSVPLPARDNFISAIDHWNLAWMNFLEEEGLSPFPLFAVIDKNNLYNGKPGTDDYNFLFFIDDKFSRYESNPSTQAITAIASSGDEIRDTDILINNEAFNYYYDSSYNEEITLAKNKIENSRAIASSRSPGLRFKIAEQLKQWWDFLLKPFKRKKPSRHIAKVSPRVPRNMVDFPSLIIHELGHVPGLAHASDEEGRGHREHSKQSSRSKASARGSYLSVMEPSLSSGRARREITSYDLKNLFCGYFNY